MIIKLLGTGCPNCIRFEANIKKALEELSLDAQLIKVTKIEDIMATGVMSTPGLIIDDKVVSYGKVLDVVSLKKLLSPSLNALKDKLNK